MTTDYQPKVKIAPNSKESEMMVLGCMLTSINGLISPLTAWTTTDFYYSEHKLIFHALKIGLEE